MNIITVKISIFQHGTIKTNNNALKPLDTALIILRSRLIPKVSKKILKTKIEQYIIITEVLLIMNKMSLEEYKKQVADFLRTNGNYSTKRIEADFKVYEKLFPMCLEDGLSVESMATMIACGF